MQNYPNSTRNYRELYHLLENSLGLLDNFSKKGIIFRNFSGTLDKLFGVEYDREDSFGW